MGHGRPKILVGEGHNAFGPTNNWPVCSSVLTKISKIGATGCQILRLKCTKFAIGLYVRQFSGKFVKLVPPDVRF